MRSRVFLIMFFLLPVLHVTAAEISAPSDTLRTEDDADIQARHEQKLRISGGPSIALVASNFIHSPMEGGKSKIKYGFGIGGFLDMGINDWFSIQPELMVEYDVSGFRKLGETGIFRHVGIELPIYAKFHINLNAKDRINLGIGPFTNFGMYGTYEVNGKHHNVYELDNATGLSTMKDNFSGIALKVGYEFRFGLQLNCSYKISASNVLDENSSEVQLHPQTASFEISYRF